VKTTFERAQKTAREEWELVTSGATPIVRVGTATCGRSAGALDILDILRGQAAREDVECRVVGSRLCKDAAVDGREIEVAVAIGVEQASGAATPGRGATPTSMGRKRHAPEEVSSRGTMTHQGALRAARGCGAATANRAQSVTRLVVATALASSCGSDAPSPIAADQVVLERQIQSLRSALKRSDEAPLISAG